MNTSLAIATGLAAGLAASPHCALMCGPLQLLPARHGDASALMPLHGGRIAGYAALGALAGAIGLLLFRQLPSPQIGMAVQAFAALVLIGIGLHHWRHPSTGCAACPRHQRSTGSWFARGLLRAALPCAALYAMLFLAASWQQPLQGMLLLAAFGIGTLPVLGGASVLIQRYGMASRTSLAPLLLIASGVLAMITLVLHDPVVLAWCFTPRP